MTIDKHIPINMNIRCEHGEIVYPWLKLEESQLAALQRKSFVPNVALHFVLNYKICLVHTFTIQTLNNLPNIIRKTRFFFEPKIIYVCILFRDNFLLIWKIERCPVCNGSNTRRGHRLRRYIPKIWYKQEQN